MSSLPPFHIAFPVDDLRAARDFYSGILGCREGRSSEKWVDFDFYGHQIVAHLVPDSGLNKNNANLVDHHQVPVPHFGVILDLESWNRLTDQLKGKNIKFVIEPYVRFANQPGEQATMFLMDPAGNALEFKAFNNLEQIFEK